jgi:hypothetical protein
MGIRLLEASASDGDLVAGVLADISRRTPPPGTRVSKESYNEMMQEIWAAYRAYVEEGKIIYKVTGSVRQSGLKLMNPLESYGNMWNECNGCAWADPSLLVEAIRASKAILLGKVEKLVKALVDDLVKDFLGREMANGLIMAMLGDGEDPELGFDAARFRLENVNAALHNTNGNFEEILRYFCGRSPLEPFVAFWRKRPITQFASGVWSAILALDAIDLPPLEMWMSSKLFYDLVWRNAIIEARMKAMEERKAVCVRAIRSLLGLYMLGRKCPSGDFGKGVAVPD